MTYRGHGESEKLLILIGAKSDSLRNLMRDLEESGAHSLSIESTDDLIESLDPNVYGVVMIRASYVQAKRIRRILADCGGKIAQIPLIFLLHPAELDGTDLLAKSDDFLLEPCDAGELLARIEAQYLRRISGEHVIQLDELTINPDSYQVFLANRPVDLTPKEFQVLKLLALNPGKVFTREELLREVWSSDYYGGTRTVDVHIRRIRSKIETFRAYIDTVHGVGYRMME